MKPIPVDPYVFEVLMRDLVGHDRRPSAFIVYVALWARARRGGRRRAQISLQQLAEDTGLSKSAVQQALRVLVRRRLVRATRAHATAVPEYEVHRPWAEREAARRSAAGGR